MRSSTEVTEQSATGVVLMLIIYYHPMTSRFPRQVGSSVVRNRSLKFAAANSPCKLAANLQGSPEGWKWGANYSKFAVCTCHINLDINLSFSWNICTNWGRKTHGSCHNEQRPWLQRQRLRWLIILFWRACQYQIEEHAVNRSLEIAMQDFGPRNDKAAMPPPLLLRPRHGIHK
jgi:hypothetical protein